MKNFLPILFCAPIVLASVKYTPVVKIQSGTIRGFRETLTTGQVVRKYLGVPYARAERFERPVSPKPWTGVKDMLAFGKLCYQPRDGMKDNPNKAKLSDMSEDCLNLNIYVPDTASAKKRPVMVWIHGGSFLANSNRICDGSFLSTLGDVIVVTINYRLSILGFLHDKPTGFKGNYGLFDQLESLKWVKNNIAAFGGNPSQVTIFGNSAGGASVSFLSLSPLAKGLFKYAIMQSGVSNNPFSYTTYEDGAVEKYKKTLTCPKNADTATCLKSLKILDLFGDKAPDRPLNLQQPVVDGEFIKDFPEVLIKKKKFLNPESTMFGVADDDGSCITNAIPELSDGMVDVITGSMSRKCFLEFVENSSQYFTKLSRFDYFKPSYYKACIHEYSPWGKLNDKDETRRAILDFLKDSVFLAPAVANANAFVRNDASVYFYQVEYGLKENGYFSFPSFLKGYHETEKFMVFGFPLKKRSNLQTTEGLLSKKVIKMWSNFAKTGNPNTPASLGALTWPKYNLQTEQYFKIKPTMSVSSKLRPRFMAFWNNFLPSLNGTVYDSCVKKPKIKSGSGLKPGSGSGSDFYLDTHRTTGNGTQQPPFLGLF